MSINSRFRDPKPGKTLSTISAPFLGVDVWEAEKGEERTVGVDDRVCASLVVFRLWISLWNDGCRL